MRKPNKKVKKLIQNKQGKQDFMKNKGILLELHIKHKEFHFKKSNFSFVYTIV